jgi:hypothetical protein
MAVRTGKARRGNVFVDRYHARTIRTPKQARNALAYVLNNWRKHRENRNPMAREHRWRLDPFSSAPTFEGWRDIDASAIAWPTTYEPLPVWEPKTWLLREGWKKHGLISSTEIPSENAARESARARRVRSGFARAGVVRRWAHRVDPVRATTMLRTTSHSLSRAAFARAGVVRRWALASTKTPHHLQTPSLATEMPSHHADTGARFENVERRIAREPRCARYAE